MTHTNALTNKEYTRGNVTKLGIAKIINNYAEATWATYKQWLELGRQVQKGSKGVQLKKMGSKEQKDKAGEKHENGSFVRTFVVFNIAQTTVGEAVTVEVKPEAKEVETQEVTFEF